MYSALKRDGVPLYKLARRGVEVERAPRDVVIHALTLRLVAPDAIDFEVRCSKGTYVRVLAADLGRALGTVAHLERLRRTQVGRFRVDDARPPDAIHEAPVAAWPLIGIAQALAGLRRFTLAAADVATLRRGQQGPLGALPAGAVGEAALVLTDEGAVAAVIEVADAERGWRTVRVLAQ
jgi:tRNA pseudouridine55 synthase